jgi:hypothetical protein
LGHIHILSPLNLNRYKSKSLNFFSIFKFINSSNNHFRIVSFYSIKKTHFQQISYKNYEHRLLGVLTDPLISTHPTSSQALPSSIVSTTYGVKGIPTVLYYSSLAFCKWMVGASDFSGQCTMRSLPLSYWSLGCHFSQQHGEGWQGHTRQTRYQYCRQQWCLQLRPCCNKKLQILSYWDNVWHIS